MKQTMTGNFEHNVLSEIMNQVWNEPMWHLVQIFNWVTNKETKQKQSKIQLS